MEGLNIPQHEVVLAKKSERPYIVVAKTKGGKLYANFEYAIGPLVLDKKTLPVLYFCVRFASDGGSWGMEERAEGSQLGELTNLEKHMVPICLAGPIAYTEPKAEEKKVVERFFAWLEYIAAKNKAEVTLKTDDIKMIMDQALLDKVTDDPVTTKFPHESAKPSGPVAPKKKDS